MSVAKLGILLLFAASAAAASGCGNKACGELKDKLCAGKDKESCQKIKAWVDSEMTGPDDKKLSDDESDLACKMILEEQRALDAWKKRAERELTEPSEPPPAPPPATP